MSKKILVDVAALGLDVTELAPFPGAFISVDDMVPVWDAVVELLQMKYGYRGLDAFRCRDRVEHDRWAKTYGQNTDRDDFLAAVRELPFGDWSNGDTLVVVPETESRGYCVGPACASVGLRAAVDGATWARVEAGHENFILIEIE